MKKKFYGIYIKLFPKSFKKQEKQHKLHWEACEVPKNKIIAKPGILM